MFDAKGVVIYVGKAKHLKKRLTSYFRSALDQKTQNLMAQVDAIKTIITANENDALLLEASLIKEYRPRYNVLLRDDKSYPYLYLSTHQRFPRLDFYRGSKIGPGRYFGPFPSAGSVRENLALIQKLFQLRQCQDSFFKNRSRPCLQYQIKRCTAPCVGYVGEAEYQLQVSDAILFLEGKNSAVVERLTLRMESASQQLDYELAAYYRDQVVQLRQMQKQQSIVGGHGDIDIIGCSQSMGEVAVVVLYVRGGRLIGDKIFFPNVPKDVTEIAAVSAFIIQYYLSDIHREDLPEKIILSEPIEDRLWIQNALSQKFGRPMSIIQQERRPYVAWQHMAKTNAKQAIAEYLASKKSIATKLLALQQALQLPNAIRRIECFDISHMMGEATIASCVVFGEAGAIKKDYRRFNITDVTPGDDYGALYQALSRRYTRLKTGEGVLPDLLMIDGGWGQLRQAALVLEELQVSGVILMAIAKGPGRKAGLEKLYLWDKKKEIHLKPDDVALHVLQYIRDEAHRFAIVAHRAKRGKNRFESPLQTISGIGPKRKKSLINYFGGLQELHKASIAEISQVPGISKSLAKKIFEQLHR